MKFHHYWSPLEKIFLANPGKNPLFAPWKKSFRRPCL